MLRLERISKINFDLINEFKQDYINNAEGRIQGSGSLEKYSDLNQWIDSIKRVEAGKDQNIVRTTYYFIFNDDELVGTICFRHELTEKLKEFGGQIGYSIKPSARRKGFASDALKLLLEKINEEVVIMCEVGNIASNKVIKKNGGILIDSAIKYGLNINRYKVPATDSCC